MSWLELQVYEIFKIKLGEQEAAKVIEFIDAKAEEKAKQKADTLASKEDLANTKVDIIKWMVGIWIIQMAAILGLYMNK